MYKDEHMNKPEGDGLVKNPSTGAQAYIQIKCGW